jgi:hypothetical protein
VYRRKLVTPLALEKTVGDEWVVAYRDAIPHVEDEEKGKLWRMSKEEFARINPGETRWGTWSIRTHTHKGKGSHIGVGHEGRSFELEDAPGVYRIVLGLFSTEEGEDVSREHLPLEECVSNEFEIVEKD